MQAFKPRVWGIVSCFATVAMMRQLPCYHCDNITMTSSYTVLSCGLSYACNYEQCFIMIQPLIVQLQMHKYSMDNQVMLNAAHSVMTNIDL